MALLGALQPRDRPAFADSSVVTLELPDLCVSSTSSPRRSPRRPPRTSSCWRSAPSLPRTWPAAARPRLRPLEPSAPDAAARRRVPKRLPRGPRPSTARVERRRLVHATSSDHLRRVERHRLLNALLCRGQVDLIKERVKRLRCRPGDGFCACPESRWPGSFG